AEDIEDVLAGNVPRHRAGWTPPRPSAGTLPFQAVDAEPLELAPLELASLVDESTVPHAPIAQPTLPLAAAAPAPAPTRQPEPPPPAVRGEHHRVLLAVAVLSVLAVLLRPRSNEQSGTPPITTLAPP